MSTSPTPEGEMVPALIMSNGLFLAAINGTMTMPAVGRGEHQPLRVTDAMGDQPIDQAELQHVTHSRDTLLHLLVTRKHNLLASSVFQRHESLLRAQNKMLETPLHSAAKVGNIDFIIELKRNHSDYVNEVLRMRNKNDDTALHVAAKHGSTDFVLNLMGRDREVNDEMVSLLNIAIINGNLKLVGEMLQVNRELASTPISDGMFPVHLAARMGLTKMVMHFIVNYPKAAKLLDPRGRNILHIAAEEGRNLDAELDWKLATEVGQAAEVGRVICRLDYTDAKKMLKEMNKEMDYEGNSLLHVAAMKGHLSLMQDIWEKYNGLTPIDLLNDIWEKYNGLTPIEKNSHGLTPIDLFLSHLRENNKVDDSLARTIDQQRLSHKWFNNAMQLSLENQWERTQVIGLGSVLIITVTFASAFTIPGGYNQYDGTPVLVRSYMFRAFIIANTLAFIYGFLSLYILLKRAAEGRPGLAHLFAIDTFLLAAYSMLLAFGLGLYATLASVCRPIAIIILCVTILISFVNNINVRSNNWIIGLASYAMTILLIFSLAKV